MVGGFNKLVSTCFTVVASRSWVSEGMSPAPASQMPPSRGWLLLVTTGPHCCSFHLFMEYEVCGLQTQFDEATQV